MKTETKEIYKCDFCNKLYQKKNACEWHEKVCTRNPDNVRLCHNCEFIQKKMHTIFAGVGDEYGVEQTMYVNILYCTKKEHFLYPPKVEHKKSFFDTGDIENKKMPKQCDCYKLLL